MPISVPRFTSVFTVLFATLAKIRYQIGLLCLVVFLGSATVANAQINNLVPVDLGAGYPSEEFYFAMEVYRSGDLVNAIDAFDVARRRTRRDINGHWIDAIPVFAMIAECQWHLGDLPAARQALDQVNQIVVRHRGWLSRIEWASVLQANVQKQPALGLWPRANAVNLLPVARRMNFTMGERLTEQTIQRGGAIEPLSVKSIDVIEIMRGVAVASYRRRMIMGPLAEQDTLASDVIEATRYPAGLQIPVARSLIGSMRCTEKFAAYDDTQAVADAVKYGVVNNGVHPLSALAILSHASAVAGSQKPADATAIAANAVNIAGASGQYEYVGEAMQLAAGCADEKQAEAVRVSAEIAATALLRKSRLAALHCMLAGADAAVTTGNLDVAAQYLTQGRALLSRRDVYLPRIAAYGGYVAARLAAAQGNATGISAPSDVDKALELVRGFSFNRKERNRKMVSIPRLYQLELIRLQLGKRLGGQSSDKLLSLYCSDPAADVWRRDPVDAMASSMVDRTQAITTRLQIAVAAKSGPNVWQRADELFHHRFKMRLALGGRITEARSLTRSDEELIGKAAGDFRNKGPTLVKNLRKLAAAKPPANKEELIASSGPLESLATQIALSRIDLPRTMLPALQPKTALARIPKGTAVLTFIQTGTRMYGIVAANGKAQFWPINGASRLNSEVGRVLRAIGVGKVRGKRLPEDTKWKDEAIKLRKHLIAEDVPLKLESFDRIVIIPDGPLWYLPFEILPIGDAGSELLGDKVEIRYAATPGLAMQATGKKSVNRKIAIAADKFFAPRDLELNNSITQSIADSAEDAVRLPTDLNVPTSLLSDSVGHLLVAAPTVTDPANPFAATLASYDQGAPAGTLAAWMRFPARVPESVVLSGFRSSVDRGQVGNGEDIFLTICALQSAGVRNVMLSRWIVGGESTALALGELIQELPFEGMHNSWGRAKAVLRSSTLDPTTEPMLTKAEHDIDGLKGDQPFFWSGYLVAAPFGEKELLPAPAVTPAAAN